MELINIRKCVNTKNIIKRKIYWASKDFKKMLKDWERKRQRDFNVGFIFLVHLHNNHHKKHAARTPDTKNDDCCDYILVHLHSNNHQRHVAKTPKNDDHCDYFAITSSFNLFSALASFPTYHWWQYSWQSIDHWWQNIFPGWFSISFHAWIYNNLLLNVKLHSAAINLLVIQNLDISTSTSSPSNHQTGTLEHSRFRCCWHQHSQKH